MTKKNPALIIQVHLSEFFFFKVGLTDMISDRCWDCQLKMFIQGNHTEITQTDLPPRVSSSCSAY